jgi:hypothetical protein
MDQNSSNTLSVCLKNVIMSACKITGIKYKGKSNHLPQV